MVAAKLANLTKSDAARVSNDPTANLQSQSRAKAAELLNVSERSVNTAKKVERGGAGGVAGGAEARTILTIQKHVASQSIAKLVSLWKMLQHNIATDYSNQPRFSRTIRQRVSI